MSMVSEKQVKLNIGCFDKKIHGFVNIDIRSEVGPDVVDDGFKLDKFENDSVDLIYCSHMLEHLNFDCAIKAVSRWYDVLKTNGVLRIAVPDMDAVFAHYFYWKDLKLLRSSLWGSQRHDFDYHRCGWDESTLTEVLIEAGFKQCKRWSPENTIPHNYIDDYSQAYYPDGHKPMVLGNGKRIDLGGKLMSLNIEAIK